MKIATGQQQSSESFISVNKLDGHAHDLGGIGDPVVLESIASLLQRPNQQLLLCEHRTCVFLTRLQLS